MIIGTVNDMVVNDVYIATAQEVIDTMKDQGKLEPPLLRVKDVLRDSLGMRFSKTLLVSKCSNNARSLGLRMEFAKFMLNLLI